MEHLDTLGIPVFHKNVMSIDLHLISFAIVVSLIHDSGVIDIFAISGPSIFNMYRRWVRPFINFSNIIIKLIFQLLVLVVPEI